MEQKPSSRDSRLESSLAEIDDATALVAQIRLDGSSTWESQRKVKKAIATIHHENEFIGNLAGDVLNRPNISLARQFGRAMLAAFDRFGLAFGKGSAHPK